jgi:serine/threonine protein kinase/TPR repeat protein
MTDTVRFQHFELLRREDGSPYELGRGAMGITYKAFDTNLRCHVALKVINSAYLKSETAQQRFLREARAAAALRHPNVATVFHLGQEGDDYFYAMEFVEGETVEGFIKREGAVPVVMALKIAAQVTRALGAAQKQGLVHRDIKPSNIMFTREDGGDFTVKVIDFGLAKNSRGESEDTATLTSGGFLGTPHFASPEQLEERETDVRSDIYSLGVTLWYMLHGEAPFSGSTAQVMSQHLHRDPPFETLQGQSTPVVNLLRRMMAKNPGDRPQTPADLRREIEECIEEIEEREVPADAGLLKPPPLPSQAPEESSATSGALLGGRYRLLDEVTASDHGRMFRAERLEDKSTVAVLILHSSLVGKSEAFTHLEREVQALQRLDHPSFQRIFSLETTNSCTFLVLEWIEGPTLLDLLRSRRALPGGEAKRLLLPLADAFDELRTAGLTCPDIAAHEIFLPGADVACPVTEWPSIHSKFLPLTTAGAGSASPDATLVASSFALMKAKGAFTGNPSTAYVYAVAALAYEMLGGVKASGSSGAYVPIPGLSEQGNAVLRRALAPGHNYGSATAFVEEMPDEVSAVAQPAVRLPMPVPPPLPGHRPRPASWGWLWTVVAVLLVIGGIVLWQGVRLVQRVRIAQAPEVASASPAPAPEIASTPMPEPASTPMPEPASTPVPESSPMPSPAPTPTLAPTPSAYEQAPAAAEDLRLRDDLAGALEAYVGLATNFPNEEQPRKALEMIAANLRTRTSKINPAEFAPLRKPLENAAALDVVSAQMLLGEMLRQSDPDDSLKWFIAAGNRGQSEAMVNAGQMLASGRGVHVPDLSEAAIWFSKAAEQGDSAGMYAMAECHLFGKGVPRDPRRAVELLTSASALNNPRAMNLLGDIYRKGVPGLIEPDFAESVQLFSRAQELGFLDAQGNLGVLYIYGQGVPKNEHKAFALFRDGAEKGNALCMLFYAMCFEGGVGVEKDREAARQWYVRAAQGGNKTALDWCKKNNIPLASPP